MESASHVSEHSALLGLFMSRNGKSMPCARTLGFTGSVHEMKRKAQAMCPSALLYWICK